MTLAKEKRNGEETKWKRRIKKLKSQESIGENREVKGEVKRRSEDGQERREE